MNQKKCPQCKNLISVKAPTCLFCGRPNKFVTNDYIRRKWEKEHNKNKLNIFKILISNQRVMILFLILIVIIVYLKI